MMESERSNASTRWAYEKLDKDKSETKTPILTNT